MLTMKHRCGYRHVGQYKTKTDSEGRFLCLNCGAVITNKRRTRYCKGECVNEFWTKNNHPMLRRKLIKQKDSRCDVCHNQFPAEKLILDHIKPIAIGGDEFDEANLQILCTGCNKVKTKRDMGKIAKTRHTEKALASPTGVNVPWSIQTQL